MKQQKGIEKVLIIILAVAVLAMSVGFAAFSQNLNITGNVTVEKSKWDIHFDTSSFALTSSNTITDATTPTLSTTSVEFAVTLKKPGDVYSFTINAVNDGTYDANLNSITMTALTAEQAKLITYTVNYDGTDYTTTTTGLSKILASKASKVVTVTVKYKDDVTAEELPQEDMNITLSATLAYVQA